MTPLAPVAAEPAAAAHASTPPHPGVTEGPGAGRDRTASTRSRRRLLLHLAGLAVLLVLKMVATPTTQPWSPDDGSYAHAVHLLEDGRWSDTRPELDLAEDPERYPITVSTVDAEGRAYPYAKHPAWIVVLHASSSLFGDQVGLVLPNLAGVLVASASAWAVARRLGSRQPALALWLTGAGPLLVTWDGLWAHGASAGLGGLAAVLLVPLVERRSPIRALALGACLGAGVLIRTEAVFLVPATALAIVLLSRRSWWGRVVDAGLATLVAAVAVVAERAWIASILRADEVVVAGGPGEPWLTSRLYASWRGLASGAQGHLGGEVLTVVAVGAVAGGVAALVRRRTGAGWALIAVGSAVAVLRAVDLPDSYVSGLFAAWPVGLAGLVLWLRRARRAPRAEWALVMVAASLVGAVGVTQYDLGAGLEWGGRYSMAVVVPLAAVAAMGIERRAVERSAPGADPAPVLRALLAATVVTGVLLALVGHVVTQERRHDAAAFVAHGRSVEAEVVIPLHPHLPRFDLASDAPQRWLGQGRGSVPDAVEDAFDRGFGRVAVVGPGADEVRVPAAGREPVDRTLVVFVAPD